MAGGHFVYMTTEVVVPPLFDMNNGVSVQNELVAVSLQREKEKFKLWGPLNLSPGPFPMSETN